MNSKIRCLTRLEEKRSGALQDILEFLVSEKVVDGFNAAYIKNSMESMIPRNIWAELEQAVKDDRLQLVDYKWEILPVERITVTVVTDIVRRDFTFNA